ncbi:MAG: SPASM domain-containing protein [Oscillospiraceae bacterium]|nr:SPASM domain-containing protein [Oscillospiraceae bacterium]
MKRFRKIYLEISNVCNLRCSFCPGTKRLPRRMTEAEFASLLPKLKVWTDYLYFHLMGEPLCHPLLGKFLQLAGDAGFKVILTTNGTLISRQQPLLLESPALHKINISLHAFEANDLSIPFDAYLDQCFRFAQAAQGNKLVVFRLWNQGGIDTRNADILSKLQTVFPLPWEETRRGIRIGDGIFLEHGDKFDWPDLSAAEGSSHVYCYGLRDQLGILCDGTVVPCCLDHEGDIPLGNLFRETMEDILQKDRTKAIYEGFQKRTAAEELCRKCGYARRFG